MDGPLSVVGLLCRTSDRTPGHARGVEALAPLLAEQAGAEARMIGSPGEPVEQDWSEDLRVSRGCLLEAGGERAAAGAMGDEWAAGARHG